MDESSSRRKISSCSADRNQTTAPRPAEDGAEKGCGRRRGREDGAAMESHARRKSMDGLPAIHRRVGDGPRHRRQLDARRLESQRTSWMARVDDDRSFVTDESLTKWMMLRHRHPPTVRFLRLFLTSSCIPRRGAPPPSPPFCLFPSSAVQEGPRTDGPEGPTPP